MLASSLSDWSQSAAGIVIVLGGVGAFLGLIGRAFWKKVDAKIGTVDKKATPNGGSTLELGDTAARSEAKIDELRAMFLLHLQNHPGIPQPKIIETIEAVTATPRRDEIEAATHDGAAQP